MCQLTEALQHLAALSLTHIVRAHSRSLSNLSHYVLTASGNVLFSPGSVNCINVESWHARLVSDLTALLKVSVHELKRLGVSLSCTKIQSACTEILFWEVWKCTVVGCFASRQASELLGIFWPSRRQPFCTPLFVEFHTLLTWLLSMSRSSAWLAMQPEHGRICRNNELLVILSQPCEFLSAASRGAPAVVASCLSQLPPNFCSLLCCIISEQFGPTSPLVPPAQHVANAAALSYTQSFIIQPPLDNVNQSVIHHLSNAIIQFQKIAPAGAHREQFSFLVAPAVLQFLKTVLLLPKRLFTNTPHLQQNTMLTFPLLMSNNFCQANMGRVRSFLISDADPNMDDVGLPLHMNAFVSTQALETDTRLLHALSLHLNGVADIVFSCYTVQLTILQCWEVAGLYSPHAEASHQAAAVRVMTRSIVGLAKQCTMQGLEFMEQQTRKRQQQHAQAVPATDDVRLAALQREGGGMKNIRTMTYFASRLQIRIAKSGQTPRLSEFAFLCLCWWQTQHDWHGSPRARFMPLYISRCVTSV